MTARRAVVLFPPRDDVADVEAIRRRWDPVMAARIAAHITLVHDVTDGVPTDDLLAASTVTTPFAVTLTGLARWGRARGIYVGVDDATGSVVRLHDRLAPWESPGWLRHGFRPHLTVVHGRYVDEPDAEAAWSTLSDWTIRRDVRVDRLAVVEMNDDGWTTIAEAVFTGS